MKIPVLTLLFVTLLFAGCAMNYGEKKNDDFKIIAMSFNIRNANGDKNTPNSWGNRKKQLCELILHSSPDVIGLQEAFHSQIIDIRKDLPEYGEIGVGREGGEKGEYSAILYKLNRFKVDESNTFWLSNTPEKPSKSEKWGNACIRICTWARFIDRKTGQSFYMFNTHLDHRSQPSREKSVTLIIKKILSRKHFDPFVLTGDFNMSEDNLAIKVLLGNNQGNNYCPIKIKESFRVLHPNEKNVGTFHNFIGKENGKKIDYIFVDQNTCVLSASIIRDNKSGKYPSDHYPVISTIEFKK